MRNDLLNLIKEGERPGVKIVYVVLPERIFPRPNEAVIERHTDYDHRTTNGGVERNWKFIRVFCTVNDSVPVHASRRGPDPRTPGECTVPDVEGIGTPEAVPRSAVGRRRSYTTKTPKMNLVKGQSWTVKEFS